jgi:hypothetical protein
LKPALVVGVAISTMGVSNLQKAHRTVEVDAVLAGSVCAEGMGTTQL